MRTNHQKKTRAKIQAVKKKLRRNDPTALWRFIDQVCMLNGKTEIPYFNDNGRYLFTQEEISGGWKDFCEALYAEPDPEVNPLYGKKRGTSHGCTYVAQGQSHSLEITPEVVRNLRAKLVNGKSPGPLGKLPAELLKYGAGWSRDDRGRESALDHCISELFQFVYQHAAAPQYWRDGVLVQLFKRAGCRGRPGNYRSIALFNVLGKLYSKLWADQATSYLCKPGHALLRTNQGGF